MEIAILYKTDEYVDYDRTNIKEQIEDILDDPDIFQLKQCDNEEDMYQIIYDTLGRPDIGVTAHNIWENKDTLYAGYFIDISEHEDHTQEVVSNNEDGNNEDGNNEDGNNEDGNDDVEKEEENKEVKKKKLELNNFGSQITSNHVTNNLIIVKRKLTYHIENNNVKTETTLDTISRYDLVNVLEKIYVKEGIVLNVDGDIKTYNYIVNPLEHLILSDSDYEKNYVNRH